MGFKEGWQRAKAEYEAREDAEFEAKGDPWLEGRLTALYGGSRRYFVSAAWKRGFDHGKMEAKALAEMEA